MDTNPIEVFTGKVISKLLITYLYELLSPIAITLDHTYMECSVCHTNQYFW